MARLKTAIVIAGLAAAAALAANLAGASETTNYTYDAKGRLIQVVHSGTVNNNVMTNYTFDDADNRKTMNVTGAP
jgi:YD repeat-containing protein